MCDPLQGCSVGSVTSILIPINHTSHKSMFIYQLISMKILLLHHYVHFNTHSCVCNTVNSTVLPSNYMYSQFKYQTYHIFFGWWVYVRGVFGTGGYSPAGKCPGYMSGWYLSGGYLS